MTTYTTHVEPGQGITFPDCKIIKGFNGIVKRGAGTVSHGPLYTTKTNAQRWAVSEAARHRAYRQQNGEGLEDVAIRKAKAREAERRMISRRQNKARDMLDLLRPIIGDMDLVRDDLPQQAIARIEKARALIAFIDTDTQ